MEREKIAVRGVNWIGDAVMTIPALRAIREYYRDSEIHLIVKPVVAPLFFESPYIDNIYLYMAQYNSLTGKFRLGRLLKKENFQKAILLQNAFDSALIAFIAGIPERIGYRRDGRSFFLTNPIPYNKEDRKIHHIDYYLELLRRAGIPAKYTMPWIRLSLSERLEARKRLSGLKKPLLAINPGATYGSAKRWFPERFAKVIHDFLDMSGGGAILLGGSAEIEISEEIIRNLGSGSDKYGKDILVLTGKMTLRELIGIISESDLLLSNDSGPMHIGYAVGAPLVAIFGSTSPLLTGPRGYRNIVIKKDVSCSPCFKRRCDHMSCMKAIEPAEVTEALISLLPLKKAVFFDRDGTLCTDPGYLNSYSRLKIYDDITMLKRLKEKGYLLIGVTNQSGISRGLVKEEFVKDVNRLFIERYGIDAFYYCPHLPEDLCECRKPEPGMLLKARSEHRIDLKGSWVVGDKLSDILPGKAVGARTILICHESNSETAAKVTDSERPDFTARNLFGVVRIILENS